MMNNMMNNIDNHNSDYSDYSDDFLKKLGIIGGCENLHSEESFKGLSHYQQITIINTFTYVLQSQISSTLFLIPPGCVLDEMATGTESDTFAYEFRLFTKRLAEESGKNRLDSLLCDVCNPTFFQNTVTAFEEQRVNNSGPGFYQLMTQTIAGIEEVLEAPLYLQEESKVETLNPFITIHVKQDVVLSSLTFIGNFLLAYLDHLLADLEKFCSVEQYGTFHCKMYTYLQLQLVSFFEKGMITCLGKLIDQQNSVERWISAELGKNTLKDRNIDNSIWSGYRNSAADFTLNYLPFLEKNGILPQPVVEYVETRFHLDMHKRTIEILLDDPVMEHPLWQDVSSQREQYSIPLTVPNILASMKKQFPFLIGQTYHQPDKIRTRAKKRESSELDVAPFLDPDVSEASPPSTPLYVPFIMCCLIYFLLFSRHFHSLFASFSFSLCSYFLILSMQLLSHSINAAIF